MTAPGTELTAYADELGVERLQRKPILDRMDERQLALIMTALAISENERDPITKGEIGHFLELCASYGLDPFAREAWIAKSKQGKLLIMVGRAGLRKIVNRNGLKMRSAVIYAKDEYSVEFIEGPEDAKPGEWEAHGRAPFHRVTHVQRGIGESRGAVVGAWARVIVRESRVEAGWFDAPLSEYMPANVSIYSPWSKQVSAMIKGAVERQAAAEATPLGGLLAEGEDESANAAATVGAGDAPVVSVELPSDVEAVVEAGKINGHERYGNRARVAMEIGGQSVEATAAYVRDAWVAMGRDPEPQPEGETITDAVVVDAEPVVEPERPASADRAESLRANAAALREEADAMMVGDTGGSLKGECDAMRAEAEAIEAEADAIEGGQEAML